MNVCQLLGVSMSFLIMDKLGRRPLLLAGSVAMLACHGMFHFMSLYLSQFGS